MTTERDAIDLLVRMGCSQKIVEHSRQVRKIALRYAHMNPNVDVTLVERGALLHDIGRSQTHTLHHGQCGAKIVERLGFSSQLAQIIMTHIGAGLTSDESTLLGLIPKDCIPLTTEEKIVCASDNLVQGDEEICIEELLSSVSHLPVKIRRRIYRLACEVELLSG